MAEETNGPPEWQRREARLMDAMKTATPAEVVGVVWPNGPGGTMPGDTGQWSLTFEFSAWRVGAGAVQTTRLRLQRPVKNSDLKKLMKSIKPYSVMRLVARIGGAPEDEGPQGLIDQIIGEDGDAELHAISQEMQKPVTHEDSRFGTLTLDRRVDWWEAEAQWNGQAVKLHVDGGADPAPGLRTAYALWDDQPGWTQRVQQYAVDDLLKLKNDNWRDDDEPEVSAEEFKSKMTLESITVHADGSFSFWHDDGDLFYGHAIKVGGSLSEGPTYTDIPG